MPDILHRVAMKSSPQQTYAALSAIDGLSRWWTTDTTGDSTPGGKVHFQFGDKDYFDMRVVELVPDRRVRWEVLDGPEEWIGTTVGFDLTQEGEFTVVLFRHLGWREPVEFMHHCSTKWAIFLMSLKSLIETGAGQPAPRDVKIDNWN